jgi:hypothetical protein
MKPSEREREREREERGERRRGRNRRKKKKRRGGGWEGVGLETILGFSEISWGPDSLCFLYRTSHLISVKQTSFGEVISMLCSIKGMCLIQVSSRYVCGLDFFLPVVDLCPGFK